MFWKEFLFIKKSIKKTKFYILEILIKIGSDLDGTLISQKKYKRNNILQLENKNNNRECLGKYSYESLKV